MRYEIGNISGSAEFLGNIEVSGSKSNEVYYIHKQFMDSVDNQIRVLWEEFVLNGDRNRHLKSKPPLPEEVALITQSSKRG